MPAFPEHVSGYSAFSAAAAQAGLSRCGGIHFDSGNTAGPTPGRQVGMPAFEMAIKAVDTQVVQTQHVIGNGASRIVVNLCNFLNMQFLDQVEYTPYSILFTPSS